MIKNKNPKVKCASIYSSDDYRVMTDCISNPYNYNFGHITKRCTSSTFNKLHNKVNFEYFNKK